MKRWVLLLMVVAACRSKVDSHRGPLHEKQAPDGVAGPDDVAFVIAKPQVTQARLPGRFAAALPASDADLERPTPPSSYVQQALATNTGGMRERLLAAMGRIHGPVSKRVEGWYRNVLGYSVAPETCSWLMASVDMVPADGRELVWKIVEKCTDPSMAAALDRDDVPPSVVITWYFDRFDGEFPFRPRVAKAAAELARTSSEDFELRDIGFAFSHMSGDESVEAMKALQATISDPKKRALVGLGMLRSKSPAGQAIGAASCKHPDVAKDPMCKPDGGVVYSDSYKAKQRAATTLDAMIEFGESTETLVAKFGKPRVLAGFEKCARTGSAYHPAWCFRNLAELDRDAAVKAAAALQNSDDEDVARMARALVKFPEVGALEKELVRLGFVLDAAKPEPDDIAPIEADDILVARGRVDAFDVETGMFPNEHDELLARLSVLAKPVLNDVVFEELAPRDAATGDELEGRPYELYAYTGGKRYALDAQNSGDWYDVNAVVGLLNALLVAKKSDVRFVLLPTGDQTAIVLAAPKAALLAASKAGLLEFAGAEDAEKAGKEFEDRVFNELSKEGNDLQRDVPIGDVRVDQTTN